MVIFDDEPCEQRIRTQLRSVANDSVVMLNIEVALWIRALAVHIGESPDIGVELAQLLDEALIAWRPRWKA